MRRFVFAPRALAMFAVASGLSLASFAPVPVFAEEERAAPPAAEPAPAPAPVRRVGEVAVTATRSERDVLAVPGNVTVIDRAAIEASGAADVPELLRRESGLFVTNDIGTPDGYRVEARGFNNGGGNGSSLLVLVDGRRVNEADSSFVDWSLIHLDRVERIEIVRGPVNTLYGDNATAGVVQIFTKDGQGAPEVTVHTRGGSYGTGEGSLFAGGSFGAFTGAFYADGYTTNGYRDESDFEAHSFHGRARWTPTENASIELQSGYSSDDRDRPGTLTKDEIRAFGRNEAEPFNDRRVAAHERFVQLRADVELAEGVTFQLLPYWRRRADSGVFEDALLDSSFDFDVDSRSWGGSSQVEIAKPLGPFANRAIAGVDFLREDTARDALSLSSFGPFAIETGVHRYVVGGFVQDELSLTDDLVLSGGVRYDRAHYKGSSRDSFGGDEELRDRPYLWSPKAAATWRFCETSSAYASYARGFRLPNFDEAIGFAGDLFDLAPQKSDAYELGVKHRGARVAANVALYWMKVENEIFLNPLVVDPAFGGILSPQNVNLDRVRHRGVELSGSWRPLDWLELYGSYTWDDTRIVRDASALDGERMPVTPRHRGTAGALVALPLGFEAGLNANVVGDRSFANDVGGDLGELDSYVTLDARVGWKRSLPGFDVALQLRVRNLTGKSYEEFAAEPTFFFALPPADERAPLVGFYPAPGRSVEAAVTITWNAP